jgi:hypothetical protein
MRTRKTIKIILGIMIITLASGIPESMAGVYLDIGTDAPLSQMVIPAPPAVIEVPGTYVYYVPNVEVDIFFYHGHWYRPYHGWWYWSKGYNGPWVIIRNDRVPYILRHMPPDFRLMSRYQDRIRYWDLNRNWRAWERERHWESHHDEYRQPNEHHFGRQENRYSEQREQGRYEP